MIKSQRLQILRSCEIAWASEMNYSPASNLYWRGLDGSTLLVKSLPVAFLGGGNAKYPPCPALRP